MPAKTGIQNYLKTMDSRLRRNDTNELSPWSSIGRVWDVPTPNLDAVIRIVSVITGVDYFTEGLTVDDLGIKGMTPEDVSAMVG